MWLVDEVVFYSSDEEEEALHSLISFRKDEEAALAAMQPAQLRLAIAAQQLKLAKLQTLLSDKQEELHRDVADCQAEQLSEPGTPASAASGFESCYFYIGDDGDDGDDGDPVDTASAEADEEFLSARSASFDSSDSSPSSVCQSSSSSSSSFSSSSSSSSDSDSSGDDEDMELEATPYQAAKVKALLSDYPINFRWPIFDIDEVDEELCKESELQEGLCKGKDPANMDAAAGFLLVGLESHNPESPLSVSTCHVKTLTPDGTMSNPQDMLLQPKDTNEQLENICSIKDAGGIPNIDSSKKCSVQANGLLLKCCLDRPRAKDLIQYFDKVGACSNTLLASTRYHCDGAKETSIDEKKKKKFRDEAPKWDVASSTCSDVSCSNERDVSKTHAVQTNASFEKNQLKGPRAKDLIEYFDKLEANSKTLLGSALDQCFGAKETSMDQKKKLEDEASRWDDVNSTCGVSNSNSISDLSSNRVDKFLAKRINLNMLADAHSACIGASSSNSISELASNRVDKLLPKRISLNI